MVCHSLLQWTTFCQNSPPWPIHLGWPHMAWLSFIELDKAVVHVISLVSFLRLCFSLSALWCPLLVPIVLLVFLLPWTWSICSRLIEQSASYFGHEVSPHGPATDLDVGYLLSAVHHSWQTIQYRGNPSLCPRSNAEEAEVEWFYEDLQDLLKVTPKKDVLFIIGDWNAKVGSQETPGVTGKCGLGVQNEAGQRLIEFCQENAVVIASTLFQQHRRRLYTWT